MGKLLTVRELADYLQVPPQTVYTWRHRGEGPPAIKVGRRHLRFREEDVQAWLQASSTNATA